MHHAACWVDRGGCGAYSCAPGRRPLEPEPDAGRLVITADDLSHARPLPAATPVVVRGAVRFTPEPPRIPRWNRLAIASLVTAVAGIPLFGIVTGLVAVVLAAVALGQIQTARHRPRGLVLALLGLFLGLADAVGWGLFLAPYLTGGGGTSVRIQESGEVPTVDDENIDPGLLRALRANVLIERKQGWIGTASGSGVVLNLEGGIGLVVTNRHVIDPDYPQHSGPPDLEKLSRNGLTVRPLRGGPRPAQVIWVAPSGVDLVVLRVPLGGDEAASASWSPKRRLRLGDPVFAIGNPYQLNWTHTAGAISQIRTMEFGGRKLRVIQTQAALNPGNSGGGLYDQKDATLIGINTWKGQSEGLGFAITLDSFLELEPPGLEPTAAPEAAPGASPPAAAPSEPA